MPLEAFIEFDKKPSLLRKYYSLLKEGKTDEELREALGLTKKEWEHYAVHFLAYSRRQAEIEATEAMIDSKPPITIPLTPERREEFIRLVGTGLAYDKAARFLNVPLVTVLDVWFQEDPLLKDELAVAADLNRVKVKQALFLKAVGGRPSKIKTTTTVTSEKVVPGAGTEKSSVTTTSESHRTAEPDVNAQKFYLINHCPDEFSIDGTVNRKGNKGRVLEALDAVINEGADTDHEFEEG